MNIYVYIHHMFPLRGIPEVYSVYYNTKSWNLLNSSWLL